MTISTRHSLTIDIAQITCRVESEDMQLIGLCCEAYKGFISSRDHDFDLEVILDPELSLNEPRPIYVNSADAKDQYSVDSYNFTADFDLQENKGSAKISGEWESFDAVLRVLYSILLPREDGLILHASGVIKDDMGYVFSGVSESGKSTIHRLSNDYKVLSDELIALKRTNSYTTIYDTPFWNSTPMHGSAVNYAPVKALFLIRKDKNTFIKDINPMKFAVEMLPNIFYDPEHLDLNQHTLDACGKIIDVTPCYEFHFLPDKDEIWRCLSELN